MKREARECQNLSKSSFFLDGRGAGSLLAMLWRSEYSESASSSGEVRPLTLMLPT
jgi:hypothetical protein